MKDYKLKFQRWWMSFDSRPKGNDRRYVQRVVRALGKKEIKNQLKEVDNGKSDT